MTDNKPLFGQFDALIFEIAGPVVCFVMAMEVKKRIMRYALRETLKREARMFIQPDDERFYCDVCGEPMELVECPVCRGKGCTQCGDSGMVMACHRMELHNQLEESAEVVHD
jgi:Zn finger protein HypA/HybF involved in hydrogenase expression